MKSSNDYHATAAHIVQRHAHQELGVYELAIIMRSEAAGLKTLEEYKRYIRTAQNGPTKRTPNRNGGRKPTDKTKFRRVSVSLENCEKLAQIGNGSITAGIETLLATAPVAGITR